ncbi:hypothetical protein L1887_32047 [Cichorium endivia]|nr:hypothetical protein L1887_32047 [Cichorium endivia]
MNLSCGALVENINKQDYLNVCVPLYNASIRGDWEAAQLILDQHQPLNLVGYGITENYETALHIAASAKTSKKMETFVQNLVNKMSREQLELMNRNYNTALCLAAAAGNVNIAKIMLKKNSSLVDIPGNGQLMPLYWASLFGKRDMILYLYKKSKHMTGDMWIDTTRSWVIQKCVEANIFDFPVIYAKVGPAEYPSDAAVELLRFIWKRVLTLPKNEVHKILSGPPKEPDASNETTDGTQLEGQNSNDPFSTLFVAAEMGNSGFLVELTRKYPDLIWEKNINDQTIFHVAVSFRHQDIFNLLQEIGSMNDMITSIRDNNQNNMLHLAGKLANEKRLQAVSGVALQMQRELLWFKVLLSVKVPNNFTLHA